MGEFVKQNFWSRIRIQQPIDLLLNIGQLCIAVTADDIH